MSDNVRPQRLTVLLCDLPLGGPACCGPRSSSDTAQQRHLASGLLVRKLPSYEKDLGESTEYGPARSER